MIKARLGERVDGWLMALLPFLFRRPINPNALSVVGVVVALAAAVVLASGHFVAGGLLILAGGFFDLIDGAIARHHGTATSFGGFLDATLDRLSDMAVLVGIAVYYAIVREPGHTLLAGCALMASVLVSYAKARAELVVPSFGVGVLERAERVIILALGALSGWMVAALWILAVGGVITTVQRFARAHREMERIDAAARGGLQEHS